LADGYVWTQEPPFRGRLVPDNGIPDFLSGSGPLSQVRRYSSSTNEALRVAGRESEHRPDDNFALIRLPSGHWLAGWFDGYLDLVTGIIDGHLGGGHMGLDGLMAIDANPATAVSRVVALSALDRAERAQKTDNESEEGEAK